LNPQVFGNFCVKNKPIFRMQEKNEIIKNEILKKKVEISLWKSQ